MAEYNPAGEPLSHQASPELLGEMHDFFAQKLEGNSLKRFFNSNDNSVLQLHFLNGVYDFAQTGLAENKLFRNHIVLATQEGELRGLISSRTQRTPTVPAFHARGPSYPLGTEDCYMIMHALHNSFELPHPTEVKKFILHVKTLLEQQAVSHPQLKVEPGHYWGKATSDTRNWEMRSRTVFSETRSYDSYIEVRRTTCVHESQGRREYISDSYEWSPNPAWPADVHMIMKVRSVYQEYVDKDGKWKREGQGSSPVPATRQNIAALLDELPLFVNPVLKPQKPPLGDCDNL